MKPFSRLLMVGILFTILAAPGALAAPPSPHRVSAGSPIGLADAWDSVVARMLDWLGERPANHSGRPSASRAMSPDEGCTTDPNGLCADAGPRKRVPSNLSAGPGGKALGLRFQSRMPVESPADTGCSTDPNGQCLH